MLIRRTEEGKDWKQGGWYPESNSICKTPQNQGKTPTDVKDFVSFPKARHESSGKGYKKVTVSWENKAHSNKMGFLREKAAENHQSGKYQWQIDTGCPIWALARSSPYYPCLKGLKKVLKKRGNVPFYAIWQKPQSKHSRKVIRSSVTAYFRSLSLSLLFSVPCHFIFFHPLSPACGTIVFPQTKEKPGVFEGSKQSY